MTKYTGTKTIKACPMSLGEAEKILGRKIETSAVENREESEGYLVEYEDGYRSWSPKDVFEKHYRVSETRLDRMKIERDDLQKRYIDGRKFTFTDKFAGLTANQRVLLRKQLDAMEAYLYILSERIGAEEAVSAFGLPGACHHYRRISVGN
jgi:hypothetical protein